MSTRNTPIRKTIISLFWLASLLVFLCAVGCKGLQPRKAESPELKVAKVDTDYVYESNIAKYVEDYRMSRRARISNFVGFSPDEILIAREGGIDKEVRDAVKRLPGVDVTTRQVNDLASKKMEELAWTLYRRLTQEKADFASLVAKYSERLASSDGGLLQPFGKVDNPENYQSRAYGMSIGDISEPFSAWDGWRIIRLENIKDDALLGKQYIVRMILLQPDNGAAEAEIVDAIAKNHTIEVLDPKYNSRRSLANGDFTAAFDAADEALARNSRDELAHYLKARALWGLDKKDEALNELQSAVESSRISEALAPYYQFYRGQYLEQLERKDDSLRAFHQSFDIWRQDVYLAYDLLDKFKELGDTDYAGKVQDEINVMAQQDAIVMAYGTNRARGEDVIVTGEGQQPGSSKEYEPGYQGKGNE